ncbi:MAG: LysM peptidoglycan-binding domain-containing protein, partial [Bacteroidia bacterium]|nr:LysM peptidoglycan-binding domain-containing protein [Bacteroidia bacterium]
MSGKLEKLRIKSFDNETYSGTPKGEYEVLFNPEKIIKKYEIEYEESQAQGTTAAPLRFKSIKPQEFDLEIIFDSTIVGYKKKTTNPSGPNQITEEEVEDVNSQVIRFKEVVFEYDGEAHDTPYLTITWGTFLFKGRMTGLDITYTLFKPDGTPIRAKANAKFKGSLDDEYRAQEAGDSSPDLTHIRIVQEGDTLPLMTYRIYGNPAYYLQVAEVNQLDDFRDLQAGETLIFPPLDKT